MLRLHTLGQVFLERGGVRVAGAAAQPRRLAVLAVLAAAGARGVSRDRLLALLWTDTEEERGRKGLNQALYALRQEIGSDDAITGTRDLVVAPEFVHSDIAEFRAALSAGDLDRAAGVYRGQFLDGFHLPGLAEFERWVEAERSGLGRDHATLLERLARRAEERGDQDAAVSWWRRLAALDPLEGRTTLRLMEALLRSGDRVGALKQARIYEVLLSQELDLPPDREVLALAERIRQMDAAPAPPSLATPGAGGEREPPRPAPVPAVSTAAASTAPPFAAASVIVEPEGAPTERAAVLVEGAPPGSLGGTPPVAAPPVALSPVATSPIATSPVATRRSTARWLAAAGVVLVAVVLGAVKTWRSEPGAPTLGSSRKITFDAGLEVDPMLAPDGRLLAYAAGSEGAMRIYVRRVDGGRAVAVSGDGPGDHRRPRWSPDGSQLLYQANGTIWSVPALGGTPRAVISAPDPQARALYAEWSPDGTELAWVQRDSIFVRPRSGGPTRALGTVPQAHSLAWSPDGAWIALVSGNEAFVYGAGSSSMQVGFTSVGNLAPSSVWLIPARGGAPVRVAGGDHLNTSPEWIAPGRLVFVSDRDGARDLFALSVGASGEPTGAPVRLTTGLGAHTASVQREGGAIAYSVFTQASNVWALPIPAGPAVGTTGATPITRGTQTVEGLEVSPDGRWLAFDADGGGSQDIYRLPLGGGDVERVVESATNDHRPSWAPDGRSLLFYAFVDGVRRAFVVTADGGSPRALAPASRDDQHTPVWSPDMRHILFHRWMGTVDQIFEMTRTGDSTWSTERQITRRGGFSPRWSPDGAHLAYIAPRQVRLMGPGPDREATSRVLYDGSDPAPTTPNPVAIRWAPDSRVLFMKTFDARAQAAIWALEVAGGPPRLMVRFDDPLRPTRRPEFTTDGKRFYFTLAQSESDVWLMGVGNR